MKLLTVKQLREEKGVPFTRQWIHELVKAGNFPPPLKYKGRRVFWLEEDVDTWFKNQRA